jgi:hypothetical protein
VLVSKAMIIPATKVLTIVLLRAFIAMIRPASMFLEERDLVPFEFCSRLKGGRGYFE